MAYFDAHTSIKTEFVVLKVVYKTFNCICVDNPYQ